MLSYLPLACNVKEKGYPNLEVAEIQTCKKRWHEETVIQCGTQMTLAESREVDYFDGRHRKDDTEQGSTKQVSKGLGFIDMTSN